MSIALLVLVGIMAMIVVGVIGLEIIDWILARKDQKRFKKMTQEEQRKYQEEMYKRHQMG